jgi:cell division protease FtsH
MEDVILKENLKNRIKSGTIDMLKNMDKYKKNNLPIKRGILMEGEPGTGKTLLAKALANEIDSTFIWVTADDVYYPSDVSYIYDMARELSPTVVLFEDIDYIGKDREGYSGSFDKITGELLNQLDGVQSNEGIITLASSNYPKALDKALRNRPGRFDIRVRFELPDAELRNLMLQAFFGEVEIMDIPFDDMVDKTEGYTGAYIKELVTATVMLAVTNGSTGEDGIAIVKKEFFNEAYNQLEESRNLDSK